MGFRKFNHFILALCALILFSSLAHAQNFPTDEDSCPTVDLRNEFDFGAVRNQKNLLWCYAYAAADIVSFKLKKQVSPFDLALSTIQQFMINDPTLRPSYITDVPGGNIEVLSQAIAKYGVCDAVKFSASNDFSAPALPEVEKDVTQLVRGYRAGHLNEAQIRKAFLNSGTKYHAVFPTSSQEDLVQALLHDEDTTYPLVGFVNQICANRTQARFNFGREVRGEIPGDLAFRSIRGILASHIPVVVNYGSGVLHNINSQAIGGHESSLVGMRFNKAQNRCEFLLRNSWGDFSPSTSYDPRLKVATLNGYTWMPEEVIRKNILATYWIY